MADNFDKVVKALLENNKSQEETTDSVNKLNKTMTEHFTYLKRQVKDQEEETTENKKTKRKAGSSNKEGIKDALGLGKRGLVGMLLPLTAGIAALSASMSGLRGWELGAIKKIKGMVALPTVLNNGLLKIRNVSLGMFGLTAEGLITKDAKGRFAKALPLTTQISNRMNSLRISALNMFGLGADGKLMTVSDGKGKFKTNIVGRITRAVSTMLSPLVNVAAGVTEFIGSKAGSFMKTIGGFAGKFGSLFLKILWPIGVLVSLFDGVKAYQESDADGLIGKLGDGVGSFLGSLIGAPFDLLKSGIRWIFNKLLGVTTDEEGNATGAGWAAWASNAMKDFSFVKTIKQITSGIFGMVEGAIEWVKLLFSDPTAALGKLWEGLIGVGKTFLDILWFPINTIFDWVSKKFGWRDEDAPKFNLRETITNWAKGFFGWITKWLPNYDGPTGLDAEAKRAKAKSIIYSGLFDENRDGFLSYQEMNNAGTGGSGKKLMNAIAESQDNELKSRYNQYIDAATVSGDTINIHKYQGPALPGLSATQSNDMQQAWQALMQ